MVIRRTVIRYNSASKNIETDGSFPRKTFRYISDLADGVTTLIDELSGIHHKDFD